MKLCIFNDNEQCSKCGECDLCELNRSKKCDNCGKCLLLEGYDVKAIKIDEVFENSAERSFEESKINIEDFSDFDNELENDLEFDDFVEDTQNYKDDNVGEYIDALDETNEWQYIEDIESVRELLEDGNSISELGLEKYPGLIVINNK